MLRKLQPKAPGFAAGLAALAALAAGALGAMTASATLPELLWCMASAGGMYSSAENCEKLITGGGTGFEWEGEVLSGETVTIDVKGLKALLLSVPGNLDIECASSSGSSELTLVEGSDIFAKGSTTFLSCKEVGGFNGSCNSTEPSGSSGEIITKELKGDLVYLKAGKATPVGMRLLPASGTVFTTISCIGGLLKETVEGSVIGEVISSLNTPHPPPHPASSPSAASGPSAAPSAPPPSTSPRSPRSSTISSADPQFVHRTTSARGPRLTRRDHVRNLGHSAPPLPG